MKKLKLIYFVVGFVNRNLEFLELCFNICRVVKIVCELGRESFIYLEKYNLLDSEENFRFFKFVIENVFILCV